MRFPLPALAIILLSAVVTIPSASAQTCANPDGQPGKLLYSPDYGVCRSVRKGAGLRCIRQPAPMGTGVRLPSAMGRKPLAQPA